MTLDIIWKFFQKIFFRDSSLDLENIINNMPGSVYWKNKAGAYLGCSDTMANFLGMPKEEIIGKDDYFLEKKLSWPKGTADSLRGIDLTIMESKIPRLNFEETPFTDYKGNVIRQISNKVPLINSFGTVVGILGNSIDITAQKKMEADLKIAKERAEIGEKTKTEFIANVSHDMRTPLSGLIGLAHWLEDDVTEAERKDLSAQLAEAGDSLLEMFEEILEDVAAEHMTENDIRLETFDLNRLVDRLAKLKKPSLTQKGLGFVVHIDPNIPTFLVSDRRKIHRTVLNLMGNAIKFTKQGHIELKIELLKKEEDQVTLKFNVIDTGIGVPEESKARLFERFYKASPSYKAEYKGFGLGLHIAKSYTHLLGGTISFESTEGVGSDFYAIVPLKIASPEEIKLYKETSANKPSLLKINNNFKPKPVSEKPSAPIKPSKPQTQLDAPYVLVIEDNLVIRRSTIRLVKKFSLNVIDVEDGKPALELAKTQHFDLILSDVGLIEMSGIEFTQQLRAFERQNNMPPVPIVGVTAHAADGRNECLEAGMNAVIPKPLSPELLSEILQNFLPGFKFKIAKKS